MIDKEYVPDWQSIQNILNLSFFVSFSLGGLLVYFCGNCAQWVSNDWSTTAIVWSPPVIIDSKQSAFQWKKDA